MNQQRSLDWNYSRRRTRDLLLDCESLSGSDWEGLIPCPHGSDLPIIYPWEDIKLNILGDKIYLLASQSGYTGTKEEFRESFGSFFQQNQQQIVLDHFANFPAVGNSTRFYFDIDDQVMYYWNGSAYAPINTMLIANTILEGGEA